MELLLHLLISGDFGGPLVWHRTSDFRGPHNSTDFGDITNPGETYLFCAIYRGYITPFITIVGARLVLIHYSR